jgi:type IV secretory pathway VirB3-like protein
MQEKITKIIIVVMFWIIFFGLLGGLDLIKNVFSVGIVWLYIITRQSIILLLIVIPLYLIYKYFINKK